MGIERFLAIERMLERYPAYQKQFVFVQIGAPSRTHIERYHDLLQEVEVEAERINRRFQSANWKPIIFLKRQHSHLEIERYYRAADLCLVTSLHDGMNLVAKEFLAARNDEDGVLVLSCFTGAARELRDALLVNPYQPVVQVWMRRQEMLKYPQAWFVECAHGNGDAQAAGEARGHLDCAHRVSVSSGTPLLPAAE